MSVFAIGVTSLYVLLIIAISFGFLYVYLHFYDAFSFVGGRFSGSD